MIFDRWYLIDGICIMLPRVAMIGRSAAELPRVAAIGRSAALNTSSTGTTGWLVFHTTSDCTSIATSMDVTVQHICSLYDNVLLGVVTRHFHHNPLRLVGRAVGQDVI